MAPAARRIWLGRSPTVVTRSTGYLPSGSKSTQRIPISPRRRVHDRWNSIACAGVRLDQQRSRVEASFAPWSCVTRTRAKLFAAASTDSLRRPNGRRLFLRSAERAGWRRSARDIRAAAAPELYRLPLGLAVSQRAGGAKRGSSRRAPTCMRRWRLSSEPAKKSGQNIPKNRCRTTILSGWRKR